jgi:hypothetical protein
MCDDCDEFPPQYVAYFNKAGGKLWRPAQKAASAWAIDIRPDVPAPVAVELRELRFVCDDPFAPAAQESAQEPGREKAV